MLRHSLVLGILLVSAASIKADFEGVLEGRLHDFGVVPRGQQLVHYFKIANPTNKTLRITNVRVSCGCTSARELDKVIPPGRETAIYAVMDSNRFVGSKAVTIYVTFDQPRYEELRTVVQAFSREDLIFSPHNITLGKVKQGDSKAATMNITIYNGGVQILDVKSDSNYVVPVIKELRRASNETTYQVEARVRPDTPVGVWFTDIWVKTNNPGYAKLRVPVSVEVEAIQPVRTDEKKIEATKTSRTVEVDANAFPAQTEEPPPYQTAPTVVAPEVVERPSMFSLFGFFRK
ncbi:MAG: DUF1573 domain-containing protein [Planctomycetota bacterium]